MSLTFKALTCSEEEKPRKHRAWLNYSLTALALPAARMVCSRRLVNFLRHMVQALFAVTRIKREVISGKGILPDPFVRGIWILEVKSGGKINRAAVPFAPLLWTLARTTLFGVPIVFRNLPSGSP